MTAARSLGVVATAMTIAILGLAALALRGGDVALAQATGTPVNVNAFRCIVLQGGQFTVPAGSMPVIRSGWTTSTSGGVNSFLAAQTTLVSVQDGLMTDVSDAYGETVPGQSGWVTLLHHPTNVTLHAAGDTMRFTFALVLDRNVTDVGDFDGDGVPDPTHATRGARGLSFGGTCTVRAV